MASTSLSSEAAAIQHILEPLLCVSILGHLKAQLKIYISIAEVCKFLCLFYDMNTNEIVLLYFHTVFSQRKELFLYSRRVSFREYHVSFKLQFTHTACTLHSSI